MEKTMDKIVALAKARGFVYPGSEIYGGLANTWDYGNLGVELKNNVKRAWWQKFVQENPYNVGVDCAILMNPQTWVASGHLGGFSDPLLDCKSCKERFRADKLIEDYNEEHGIQIEGSVDAWSQEEMKAYIDEHNIPCPSCGMTRATFDLLRLDFAGAFANHPFVFVVYPYLFFLFHYNARFLRRLSKAVRVGILAGGAALFAVIYIVRLSLGMIP